jgi:hypothetical protein
MRPELSPIVQDYIGHLKRISVTKDFVTKTRKR